MQQGQQPWDAPTGNSCDCGTIASLSDLTTLYMSIEHLRWLPRLAQHPVIGPYWRLTRMDRPVGTLLILWPTLASLWIAGNGRPDTLLVFVFALGSLIMRSAGCAINDYADRRFDGRVARTINRPLVTGELRPRQALACFCVLCGLALLLVLLTNRLTIYLSLIAVALAAMYPFVKRFSHLPQVWLGLAMNWGIIMACSAQAGSVHSGIGVLYAAAVLWCVVYDCFYAMTDREDDTAAGIKSIAILFGEQDRLICGVLQILCLAALCVAGQSLSLGATYTAVCLGGTMLLFTYQQYLIRNREPDACFAAFMNNRWVALCLFLGVFFDTSF